jgi:NAD(P)-dependent dehydrogenase (short-subunit alcohol dehydrogenase family)
MHKIRVVITGSTRGLGLSLAREFLSRGCGVVISGRQRETAETVAAELGTKFPGSGVRGFPCDVRDPDQVEALWSAATGALGRIDHWINNAGIGQATVPIWELPPADMEEIVKTDLLGVLFGARTAMRGMAAQGTGTIWFMEGFGSDGRIMTGLSVYGASKRALRYVAHALAVEASDNGVRVGTLSPGMMVTDFTTSRLERKDPAAWERTRKVFNILADMPETVAAFLTPRILAARKNCAHIEWLTSRKIMFRFLTAGLTRRRVMPD